MLGAMQRMLVLGFGWLLCAQVARAESFDQIVEAYGGAAAFDIILVQDCSVLDNSSEAALDQEYNAKLCSAEDESALSDVANLLRSKGFNTVEVALSTAGAQVRPEARKSASDIRDIYVAPELSSAAREAYIATLRGIARGIDVDAEARLFARHALPAAELFGRLAADPCPRHRLLEVIGVRHHGFLRGEAKQYSDRCVH